MLFGLSTSNLYDDGIDLYFPIFNKLTKIVEVKSLCVGETARLSKALRKNGASAAFA